MKITIGKLRNIISESIKNILLETYNADLYHFTNLEGMEGILSKNLLAITETGDDEYDENSEAVCLSRTGNPYIGYCPYTPNGLIFRITLDTNKMSSSIRGMKIKPWSMNNSRTEFYGDKYNSVSDYEERAYEDIYPLTSYCKSIDVFTVYKGDEFDDEQLKLINDLLEQFPAWKKYFGFMSNGIRKVDFN